MSVVKDVKNKLKMQMSVVSQVATTDINGASVDTKDTVGVALMAMVGASGDTLSGSVKIELEVEHSDDGSTFVDCANADLDAAVAGTNTGTFAVIDAGSEDEAIYKVNYIGNKRYVRCVANLTGTHTNGTPLCVAAVMMPVHMPA